MMESLASSEGWKESAPRRIQRWVSFTGRRNRTRMRRRVVPTTIAYTTAGWRSLR
jgi:hypothetical protein